MDKYIILTAEETYNWGAENILKHGAQLRGSDGSFVFGFTAIPSEFNSKTVYSKSEILAMKKDNASIFNF